MRELASILLGAAAFLACWAGSTATSGFATGLSNSGLDAFKNAVLPMVNQELAQFTVRLTV
jgi:hypothetical protein